MFVYSSATVPSLVQDALEFEENPFLTDHWRNAVHSPSFRLGLCLRHILKTPTFIAPSSPAPLITDTIPTDLESMSTRTQEETVTSRCSDQHPGVHTHVRYSSSCKTVSSTQNPWTVI